MKKPCLTLPPGRYPNQKASQPARRGVLAATPSGWDIGLAAGSDKVSSSFLYAPAIQRLQSDTMVVGKRTGHAKEESTMMGWYGGGMGPLGWILMGLFWFILLGLIVW